VLNVTSLRWLDTSRAVGPQGDIWSHLVYVIIPNNLTYTNTSHAYLTGQFSKNDVPNKVANLFDIDVLMATSVSEHSQAVTIAVKNIPNGPIVFPSDPDKTPRIDDALLAWAWHEYFIDPKHDPEWLPHLPMVKAGFQTMRAAQEFLLQEKIADTKGWVVSGASKRGWAAYGVATARCAACVNVKAIIPIVPIVPDLDEELHRMWKAYDGFSWIFSDYLATNITQWVDEPIFKQAMKI